MKSCDNCDSDIMNEYPNHECKKCVSELRAELEKAQKLNLSLSAEIDKLIDKLHWTRKQVNEAVAIEAQKPLESDYLQEIEQLKKERDKYKSITVEDYHKIEQLKKELEAAKKEITELRRRIPLEKEIEILRRLMDTEHELKMVKEQIK